MTKRIVIHFEDEAGQILASQISKHKPAIGDIALMCGVPYVVFWRRDSSTSVDFGARPDRAGVEVQEFVTEDIRPMHGQG